MAEYIDREEAAAIIEAKQKELCPVGRYGRSYVYGLDREKYDSWEEIIDALVAIPAADVAPVVHGKWDFPIFSDGDLYDIRCKCSECGSIETPLARHKYCPNCGAKMDL